MMKIDTKKNKLISIIFSLILLFLCGGRLFPEFIIDDEEEEGAAEIIKEDRKKSGLFPASVAVNIKAEKVDYIDNAIRISWNVTKGYDDVFIVGRSNQVINSKERALAAKSAGKLQSRSDNFIVDTDLAPGKYFYVVLAESKIAKREIELYKDINYTSFPVIIDPPKEKQIPTNITVKKGGVKKILITWNKIPGESYYYAVYRDVAVLDQVEKLTKKKRIALVNNKDYYIDDAIEYRKSYYYAVVVEAQGGKEKQRLVAGENYTTTGMLIKNKIEKNAHNFAFSSMQVKKIGKNIILRWDYSGKPEFKFFALYRTRKKLERYGEVRDRYIIKEVDITKKEYIEKNPPPGSYFYGLMPYGMDYREETAIVIGKNCVGVTIDPQKKHREKPEKGNIKKEKSGSLKNIDLVLKRTYYVGNYRLAIKELQKIVKKTENKREAAKAKLFIGKSLIEIKQYRKAVEFLVLTDVEKYYPKEARFWREMALMYVD